MARIAATFTVIFLLFAVSHARSPLDVTENDVDIYATPESKSKITILLPSEIPDSESNSTFDLLSEIVEQEDVETETISVKPIEDFVERGVESIDESDMEHPLKMLNFRPMNRHFPHVIGDLRPPFFPRRPCRHQHRKHLHGEQPHGEERELSYGNDMILSKESMNTDLMFHGDEEPRFHPHHHDHHHHHHGGPRHEMWNEEEMKEMRPFRHHMEDDDEDDHEHMGGGFMEHIRKFLNHHF